MLGSQKLLKLDCVHKVQLNEESVGKNLLHCSFSDNRVYVSKYYLHNDTLPSYQPHCSKNKDKYS